MERCSGPTIRKNCCNRETLTAWLPMGSSVLVVGHAHYPTKNFIPFYEV